MLQLRWFDMINPVPLPNLRGVAASCLLACAVFSAPGNAQELPLEELADELAVLESGNSQEGILHLNQTNADATNQDNIFAGSTVAGDGAAISDATSSQNSLRLSVPNAVQSTATISGVAQSARGIVGLNQSASAGSSQANLLALSVTSTPSSFASASALGSSVSDNSALSLPVTTPSATIHDLGNDLSGIAQVNQLAGSGGSQMNVIALASAGAGIASADAAVLGAQSGSSDQGDPAAYPALAGPVSLGGSFNASVGVVQLNQATGGANRQANLIAAAFGEGAIASAVTDHGLQQVRVTQDQVPGEGSELDAERTGFSGSFDGFAGVAQVSQVSGYGNSTANTFSVSVSNTLPGQ